MPSVQQELSEEKEKHRVGLLMYITLFNKAFCNGKYLHPPHSPFGEGISNDVIWGKICKEGREYRGSLVRRGEKTKGKGEIEVKI